MGYSDMERPRSMDLCFRRDDGDRYLAYELSATIAQH